MKRRKGTGMTFLAFAERSTQGSVVLLLIALAAVLLLLYLVAAANQKAARSAKEAESLRESLDGQLRAWNEERAKLTREIEYLSPWRDVADADAEAGRLREQARAVLAQGIAEAQAVLAEARRQAEEALTSANAKAEAQTAEARAAAREAREKAQALLDSATLQAKTITDAARSRAEEIAGDAYKAMNNAALYEQTVKAMKNVIEGYGDAYIVPSQSLLDGLAEDFGHTEAGEKLKLARERSKLMVRNKTAATCEYVEENRRTTAIEFVTDAFNGKVDSILSRVKHDNAGTLEQEIRDAFTLVNYNGKAFREARITEEYLSCRLEELRWAAIAQKLRLDEREEQRRIKEAIREEEKARREFERAIRDAAKEEEVLRKAMEKAQQQIEQASAEQRAKYERQLEELAARLKEAEERSQRAVSMAQQTKCGHVYVISNVGSFGDSVYKIGLTRRLEPQDRIRELGDSSVPFEFDVHALIYSEDAPGLEHRLHKHFVLNQVNKVNHRKEFFRANLAQIREEIEGLGLSAAWTMTAKAAEYRETLAIEKAIAADPKVKEAWVKRQWSLEDIEAPGGELAEGLSA